MHLIESSGPDARIASRRRLSRRLSPWLLLGALAMAVAALFEVSITGPRVALRWADSVDEVRRLALERQYDLRNAEPDEQGTWRYDLRTTSRENIRALITDPAVADTHYIDRDALTTRGRDVQVRFREELPYPLFGRFDRLSQLVELNSSLWLWLPGIALLAAARSPDNRRRRAVGIAALLAVGVAATAFPIPFDLVHMGDAGQVIENRRNFSNYAAVNSVRFEAHLAYAVMGQLDRLLGGDDLSPERAQIAFAQAATIWFVLCALAVGVLERWSSLVLRYLALALFAPSALMYFSWREIGYTSLNVASFPLLARGLQDRSWKLEAGGALAGLGAALHGWGLMGLAGSFIAALVSRAAAADRFRNALRVAVWGTAAYVGWIAIYVIVLKLPVVPGHVQAIPWRPLFAHEVFDGRVNPAIFSAYGAGIILMTAWVVGFALLPIAASLWRGQRDDVRVALAYALPSTLAMLFIWHTQGLKQDMDVVFGIFPALYALAWVCAHDVTRTKLATAFLVSAHAAFWWIVLDPRFDSITLE